MSTEIDYLTRTDYQNVLPAEITQRVDKVLDFVQNSKDTWFTASIPEEVNLIIPDIQSIVDRLHISTSGFGEVETCLNCPVWPIDEIVEDAAKAAGREYGMLIAQTATYNATGTETSVHPNLKGINPEYWWYDPIALGFSAAFAASWETVSDLERFRGKENPGMLILELYKLGAARIEFKKVDEEKKLVIDFPILLNGNPDLGCWVERDRNLNFYHPWNEPCANIKPISATTYFPRIIKPLKEPFKSTHAIAASPIPDKVKKLLEDPSWL